MPTQRSAVPRSRTVIVAEVSGTASVRARGIGSAALKDHDRHGLTWKKFVSYDFLRPDISGGTSPGKAILHSAASERLAFNSGLLSFRLANDPFASESDGGDSLNCPPRGARMLT
jgi:hypothetical protein